MERTLIVTLLQKSIEELAMMTDGFMEMTEYPAPILRLARRKAEDVLEYLGRLEEATSYEPRVTSEDAATPPVISNETNSFPQDIEPDAGISSDGRNDEEAAGYEPRVTSEDAATPPVISNEANSFPQDIESDAGLSPEGQNDEEAANHELQAINNEDTAASPVISNDMTNIQQDTEPDVEIFPDGRDDEEAASHELQATSEEEVLEEAVTSEETSSPVQPPAAPHTDNTIADAHSMKKVDDIRQAISIGDQFRFQRELFAGNGELMHKTIAKLNQMGSLDEAMKYLQAKFSWNAEDEIVEHFLQIIRRRW